MLPGVRDAGEAGQCAGHWKKKKKNPLSTLIGYAVHVIENSEVKAYQVPHAAILLHEILPVTLKRFN